MLAPDTGDVYTLLEVLPHGHRGRYIGGPPVGGVARPGELPSANASSEIDFIVFLPGASSGQQRAATDNERSDFHQFQTDVAIVGA